MPHPAPFCTVSRPWIFWPTAALAVVLSGCADSGPLPPGDRESATEADAAASPARDAPTSAVDAAVDRHADTVAATQADRPPDHIASDTTASMTATDAWSSADVPSLADAPSSGACVVARCPTLFALAAQCPRARPCVYERTATGVNQCYDNGAKELVSGAIVGSRYNMRHDFVRAGGGLCYALETSAELAGGPMALVWKDASGATLATGIAHGTARVEMTCGGSTFDITDGACPGTAYAQDLGCTEGSCR